MDFNLIKYKIFFYLKTNEFPYNLREIHKLGHHSNFYKSSGVPSELLQEFRGTIRNKFFSWAPSGKSKNSRVPDGISLIIISSIVVSKGYIYAISTLTYILLGLNLSSPVKHKRKRRAQELEIAQNCARSSPRSCSCNPTAGDNDWRKNRGNVGVN